MKLSHIHKMHQQQSDAKSIRAQSPEPTDESPDPTTFLLLAFRQILTAANYGHPSSVQGSL